MKRLLILAVSLASCLLIACQSTTSGGATDMNRKQLLLIPEETLNQSSADAYHQALTAAKKANALNTNASDANRVKTISKKLIGQAGIFRANAKTWQWEINVINSKEVNAYCMPGGKIAVYSGLIASLNPTDDELAAVIGHEIAHALREHSREKVSQELATSQVISITGTLLGLGTIGQTAADNAAELVVTLPYSRLMETEADIMGIELMARAGYNPEASVTLWEKMGQLDSGASTPELLSTHPSDESRIRRLKQEIPKVLPLYEAAKNTAGKTEKTAVKKKKTAGKK